MKEEDLKGARSKLGLKGEVKSKTYEVMAECGEHSPFTNGMQKHNTASDVDSKNTFLLLFYSCSDLGRQISSFMTVSYNLTMQSINLYRTLSLTSWFQYISRFHYAVCLASSIENIQYILYL